MLDYKSINLPNNPITYKDADSFLRRVAVGVSHFMYDTLYMPTKKGESIEMLPIPMYYSSSGGYQYLQDVFLDIDKDCNKPCLDANGGFTVTPSGVFTFGAPKIETDAPLSKYERGSFYVEKENGWGGAVSQNNSTTRWLDLSMDVIIKIKCSTHAERLKLWECFMRTYYNARKFWIRYQGIERIPILLKFPTSISGFGSKTPRFPVSPEDSDYELEATIELYTVFPIIDPSELRESTNRIKSSILKIKNG